MSAYVWPSEPTGERDNRHGRIAYIAALGLEAGGADLLPAPQPKGRTSRRSAKAVASSAGQLWAPIGPTSALRGHPNDRGRVTGRVMDVWAEPVTGRRVYAASATGGTWFSPDAGSTWRSLGGWMAAPLTTTRSTVNPLSIGAMLVEFGAAGDGSQDVVWVGTGEGATGSSGMPGSLLSGVGVLRGQGPAIKVETDNTAFTAEATNLVAKGCFRLAKEPGGDTIVVATTAGLRERPAGAGPHADWPLAAGHPMTSPAAPKTPEPLKCVDALWTPAVGGKPKRLWAAFVEEGDDAIQIMRRDAGGTAFTDVFLTDDPVGATFVPTEQVVFAATRDGAVIWVLGQGPRMWRIDTTAATPEGFLVTNVPKLWDDDKISSKIAIAVDPTNPVRVAIGGTVKKGDNGSAGLFCGVVTSTGGKFKYPAFNTAFCGEFVHPDVLAIRFSDDAKTVWVACDGGVYRSTRSAENGTFVAKNDGLAVLECGFIASHPEHDGGIVMGLQDNGTQRRVGETVWRLDDLGDGGGVAFDVTTTHRYVGQFTNTDWDHGIDPPPQPVRRDGHSEKSYEKEEAAASFYSAPGTIAKDPATTQLAIGTNRVWYTEDWGEEWRTLPKGLNTDKDARGNKKKIDNDLDVLPSKTAKIRLCRWETKDRLWVLTGFSLFRYERDAAGVWTRTEQAVNPLLSRQGKKRTTVGDTPATGPPASLGPWLDLAIHTATTQAGKLGTLYLATAGDPKKSDADQLFWFDGATTWRSVGLRTRTTAAALSVAVEPGHTEFVYVGTTIGVFRGRLKMDGSTPEWTWERLDNGLPDVAVHDLSIYSRGGIRLLRAATQARGVWELDLSGSVASRTYLRVHELDTRRGLPTALADPFTAKVPSKADATKLVPVEFPWHTSPDVRVHPRLRVQSPPASLPWTTSKHPAPSTDRTGTWRLWQFQAALRALDPRAEPNGVWNGRFEDVLKRAGAPLVGGKRAINVAFWNTVMTAANVAAPPWDAARPSEADLIEWLPRIDSARPLNVPSTSVPAGPATVQVMLHDRGFPATVPGKVRVALLRRTIGPWSGMKSSSAWAPANVGWTAAITTFLTAGTSPTLTGGWSLVAATAAAQSADAVAAGHPQAVSFDTDFTGITFDSLVFLVAVVWSEKDPVAMVEAPLRDLTLANHHVAVRSVRVIKE